MNAAYAIPPFKVFIVLSLLITWMIRRILMVGRREPLLPPGPGTTPILGNITILPKKDAYLQFGEWAKQYGEIFSLKVSSKTIVVLSSPDAVIHVMEKNGAITSDKPSAAHRPRIFGENGILAGIQYGPLYRTWRKVANEVFGRSACQRHTPTQLAETSQLMLNLLDHPEEIFDEIERAVLSLKLSVFFGSRPTSASSPEREKFNSFAEGLLQLSTPGAYPPIDILPILRLIPDRFAKHWKRKCDELKCLHEDLWGGLAARAEKKVEAGIQTGSFYEQVLGRASEWNIDRKTIRNMAAIYVMSATHTTTTTLRWFIILVTVYPHAQEKLREEIDRVVGQDRLPSPEDMPNLPYLHAFIRELHRFRTIAPLAAPHVASEDQFYHGHLIPKGATLIVNSWGIFHDSAYFDNPNQFNPERFLNPTPEQAQVWKKLETLQFGVGRRICPGMHLANASVDLMAASLIWAFEFNVPAVGGPDVYAYSSSLSCDPSPFKCDIRPQSAAKASMIRDHYVSHLPLFDRLDGRFKV